MQRFYKIALVASVIFNLMLALKIEALHSNIESGVLGEMTLSFAVEDLTSLIQHCPIDKKTVLEILNNKNAAANNSQSRESLIVNKGNKVEAYPLTYHFSDAGKLQSVTQEEHN
jgi:hypothetical protein